ncbi:MAG: c-type cytochrome [Phycisphaeraceae bacterium]|nr:c-type cytochrome [Phycisphaeraceae bacterium]
MNATPSTPIPSPSRERFALAVAAAVSLASLAGMGALGIAVGWSQRQIAVDFANVQPVAWLDSGAVSRGREAFATTCTACHNEDGKGRPGLGRDLTNSAFVRAATDDRLARMIADGRAADDPLNITKVAMPPRGGNDTLSEADLRDVVMFVRALQEPARVARGVSLVARPAAPTEAEIAAAAEMALAAAGGDEELAEYIASGTKLYASSCIACHGAAGVGMKGNGKALVNNEFIQGLDDDGLLAFIKRGRDPSDPRNTTGVGMPSKGGNPALSDDDILDIVCYLRTLQPDKPVATTGK